MKSKYRLNQIGTRLEKAKDNYVEVFNLLSAIVAGGQTYPINDIMCAYLIDGEWCDWFAFPKKEDSPLDDEQKSMDFSPQLKAMNEYKMSLELLLTENLLEVNEVFANLNPCFVARAHLLSQGVDIPDLKAGTKRYYQVLHCTAEFFEKTHGRTEFIKILRGN